MNWERVLFLVWLVVVAAAAVYAVAGDSDMED